MKTILGFIVMLASITAFAATPASKAGMEPDYVAAGLASLGANTLLGPNGAMGSYRDESVMVLHGWHLRNLAMESWPTTPSLLQFRITEKMIADHWVFTAGNLKPSDDMIPVKFFITAKRDNETLEILVVMFPDAGGLLRIAYSQRRSTK